MLRNIPNPMLHSPCMVHVCTAVRGSNLKYFPWVCLGNSLPESELLYMVCKFLCENIHNVILGCTLNFEIL